MQFFNIAQLMRKHELLAGEPLDEYLGVTCIIDLCVTELKDRLECANKDITFQGVREEVLSFTRRRRDLGWPPIGGD